MTERMAWGTREQEQEFGEIWLLWNGGPEVGDRGLAVRRLHVLAEQGFAPAQHTLAMAYLQGGRGVDANEALAFILCHRAGEQGYPPAESLLGSFYMLGSRGAGICRPDPREAVRWLTRAAKQGNSSAQYHLAASYARARGVEASPTRAYLWAALAVHCAPVPFVAAETLRDRTALGLGETERAEADREIAAMLEEGLRRPDSDHSTYWKHCADAAGVATERGEDASRGDESAAEHALHRERS